jgi:restriction endonuclease S subunit
MYYEEKLVGFFSNTNEASAFGGSVMDTETLALKQYLAKIHQLKQGMMQELLTGRTRLVKPNPVN